MKLDYPFLQLPLTFDAQILAREIEQLGETVWRPHPQGYAGNTALPLISVDGDPSNDATRGVMRPTPHLRACPYLMQVLHSLGAVWGRSRLMRLAGRAEVAAHVDINYYWREHMRVHVPIVTHPTVRFHCDDAVIHMAAGECWTFDTWRNHRVHNDDDRQRVHLVSDTVGGPGFWQLMREARPHDRAVEGWAPRHVLPTPTAVQLDYESVNRPLVMSPWEVRTHVDFLVGEVRQPSELDGFVDVIRSFLHDWRALWAKHGDGGRGLDDYRALRECLRPLMSQFGEIRLVNNVRLVQAMHAIVIDALVVGESVAAQTQSVATTTVFGLSSVGALPTVTENPVFGADTRARAAVPTFGFSPPVSAREASSPAAGHSAAVCFRRPLIALSAPRSGSTLLFETLAHAPQLYTIGHESHRAIESLPGLHPAERGFDSNRLTENDATDTIIAGLHRNLADGLRDRDGHPPMRGATVRLLEKTPKNVLRVPFLRSAFPEAQFVYLYREPRAVLASMIEAWRSGKFRTYPSLPGWSGLPWSLLLVPGWRALNGRPLEEIVALQWATATNMVVDDLEALPAAQLLGVSYDELVADPMTEVRRICAFADLGWDRMLDALPLSRHTLTPPDPEKWRRHEAAIQRVLPLVEAADTRVRRLLGIV